MKKLFLTLKHLAGQHDQKSHGRHLSSSKVLDTLNSLSNSYDFILIGSAAVKYYIGDKMSREPKDIDVLDLVPKSNIDKRFESRKDPRDPSSVYNIIDTENNIQIQTFPSGKVVSRDIDGFKTEIRMPSSHDRFGQPNYEEIKGIKVAKPSVLLDMLYSKGSYQDMYDLIKGLKLPKNLIDQKWYRAVHEEAYDESLR